MLDASRKNKSVNRFDFTEDYIVENKNVLLRPLVGEDLVHLTPFSVHEPELWAYNPIQVSANEENYFEHYIQAAVAARRAKKEYPFLVYDKRKGQYAGSTRFYDIQLVHKRLRIGYTWYGKAYQGTGLNKDCKYLLLEFAFERMQMERIGFRANAANERSIAAMKSIGCVVEGVLRSFTEAGQGLRSDAIVLSILKQEWQQKVKAELKQKLRT
jgi:RimJ/RimL family protein N-acetyltransferase